MLKPRATPWERSSSAVVKPQRGGIFGILGYRAPVGLCGSYAPMPQGVALGSNMAAPLVLKRGPLPLSLELKHLRSK